MATLINGNGNAAVYAAQDADWFASLTNGTTARMNVGDAFAHTIEDANTIALANGVIITKEGRRIQLGAGSVDTFTIPTGEQGVTNYYIIGYHLYTDDSSNQLCETFVEQMESSSATITENTFRGGATEVYVSVKRVTQESLTITDIEDLLGLYSGASDSNLATVEAGTTATQAYAADEYVVVDGRLYVVTAAVAIGDTFTEGTNITATTVGTELTELNSRLTDNGVGFQFAYDTTDDTYGYYDANGDFHSFSNATALYEALQYSGLVTEDMTFEEMCSVLAAYFPDFDGYIYNAGTYNPDYFTTSWNKAADSTYCNTSITFNSSNIFLKANVIASTTLPTSYYVMNKAITINRACKIRITVTLGGTGSWSSLYCGLKTNSSANWSNVAVYTSGVKSTFDIDVTSEYVGNTYYLGFEFTGSTSQDQYLTATITKIQMIWT